MSRTPPLIARLREACLDLGLPGARILVAVSGGADSVALMLGLCELSERLDLRLEVATVDHRLRPGSARDALYVERLARALGLVCTRREVQVRGAGGLEAAARRARYRALGQIARERGCEAIATGHTLEDQAETVLLRLARGTGTRGLRGVLARRGQVVRPLLRASRVEVRDYLRSRRVRGREDPTNASPEFARNRVRAQVLPALVDALGPSSVAAVARCAAIAAEDERLLSRLARRHAARILESRPGELCGGETGALARLPESLRARVLRLAARRSGSRLDAGHLRRMRAALAARGPSSLALPGGVEFVVRYGRFALRAGPPAGLAPRCELPIPGPGVFALEGCRVEVRAFTGTGKPAPGAMRLDPARLALPLRLRARAPGDRFRPRGGHEKKLKAWLIDQKLPREARDGLRLLADSAGKVLWIIGLRESQEAEHGERSEAGWEVHVEASGSTDDARLLRTGDSASTAVERAAEDQAPKGLFDSVQGPK